MHLPKFIKEARGKIRRYVAELLYDRYRKTIPIDLESMQKIVFVCWSGKFGDTIILSFVLRELRKAYPHLTIEIIGTKSLRDLFVTHYDCQQYHLTTIRPSYASIRELCKKLMGVDVIIHMNKSLKMRDIYLLSHVDAKHCIGIDDKLRCINHKLGFHLEKHNWQYANSRLLELLGIQQFDDTFQIPLLEKSIDRATALLGSHAQLIAFCPFGLANSRRLSIDNCIAIVQMMIVRAPGVPIYLLLEPSLIEVGRQISRKFPNSVYHTWPDGTIYDAIALLSRACMLVSVETSMVHIAKGLGVPFLGLYASQGSKFIHWSYPDTDMHISLKPSTIADVNEIEQSDIAAAFDALYDRLKQK